MNSTRRACGGELLFAFLSGTLLAVSFPNFYQSWLAWLAPGFILLATYDATGWGVVQRGIAAGLGNYLVSLFWMTSSLAPVKGMVGYLLVSVIQSIYVAGWCWVCWKLLPCEEGSVDEGKLALVERFKGLRFWQRIMWPILCAATWVAMEMCMARFVVGYARNFLGVSQYEKYSLIQVASITGVYGVSFVIVWLSVSMLAAVLTFRNGLRFLMRAVVQVLAPGAALAGVLFYGAGRLEETDAGLLPLRVALIQPDLSREVVWRVEKTGEMNAKLEAFTGTALKAQPDLVVIPELASLEGWALEAIVQPIRARHLWLAAGKWVNAAGSDSFEGIGLWSPGSATLTNANQIYRPRENQPLGEAIPAVSLIRGETNTVFETEKPRVRFAPMLNDEDMLPQEARRRAGENVDFLLHLNGDADVAASAVRWQHIANAAFRSVENGVVLVNSGNQGLSCWIDARGRINDAFFPGSMDAQQAGVKVVEIPLYGATPSHPRTFYQQHGDWFGWGCVGLIVIALALRIMRRGSEG